MNISAVLEKYKQRLQMDESMLSSQSDYPDRLLLKEIDELKIIIEALQFKQTMVDSMKSMNDILALQSENGNWNYDAYNLGLYNGIELMMSILEDRECMYRELKTEG